MPLKFPTASRAFANSQILAVLLGLLVAVSISCDRPEPQSKPTSKPALDFQSLVSRLEAVVTPESDIESRIIVVLFARTDCPISNSYAPEVRRISAKFAKRGVGFFLVYPDADETPAMIQKHVKEYAYPFPALRDPKQELVKLSGAKVTPEAAVFDADGKLLYRGRIDDRYIDFGKARAAPTVKDLEQALEAILAGKTAPPAGGPAIGCMIPDVK
jgi:thiol-disulfide isomerase/thioredoxin